MAMTRNSQPSGLRGWRLATTNPTAVHGTPMTSATTPSPSNWASTDSGIKAASNATATPPSTTDQTLLRMMAAYGRIVPGTLPHAGPGRGRRPGREPQLRRARVGTLQGGDVELLHGEHRRLRACCLLLVAAGDHVEEPGRHDLPGKAVLVDEPAAGDSLAAVGQPVPVVVDLGLVGALDDDRHCGAELVQRAAVERQELLAVELELHRGDGAFRARPRARVPLHPAEAGVLEDSHVVVRRLFALGVEPQAGGERLAGHRTSPSEIHFIVILTAPAPGTHRRRTEMSAGGGSMEGWQHNHR